MYFILRYVFLFINIENNVTLTYNAFSIFINIENNVNFSIFTLHMKNVYFDTSQIPTLYLQNKE